jgi:SAM-dependent methyltransferase
MDEGEQVQEYVDVGSKPGIMTAAYLFHSARICQVISGCRRVLDLGCGPATQLVEVASFNADISFLGMDLSETMLQAGRKYIADRRCKNIELKRGDITSLKDFGPASVDGVISTMALHHLPTAEHLSLASGKLRVCYGLAGRFTWWISACLSHLNP